MKVDKVPVKKAAGHILVHNQAGPDGRKVLKKGRRLTTEDVARLQSLGKEEIYAAILAPDDVGENEAAQRVGEAIVRAGIDLSTAVAGRVNLMAAAAGLFKVNIDALLALNDVSGVTLATLPTNTLVEPKKIVGTIKIIPYALPRNRLEVAETVIKGNSPLVKIEPFVVKKAVLITTGSEAAQQKVMAGFTPALRERLATYGVTLVEGPYTPENEEEIGQAVRRALTEGAEMILIAGETSIMDAQDITPQAIKAIGSEIIHYGVPVEPGNLLMLAYHGQVPIVGAPGCARSRNYNVIDMVLPRLAAGERLTRRDLIALGHGGYLHSH